MKLTENFSHEFLQSFIDIHVIKSVRKLVEVYNDHFVLEGIQEVLHIPQNISQRRIPVKVDIMIKEAVVRTIDESCWR